MLHQLASVIVNHNSYTILYAQTKMRLYKKQGCETHCHGKHEKGNVNFTHSCFSTHLSK
jgi:hypothetical protein